MTERVFQAKLIKEIKALFPSCIVLKNDEGYLQGIPDLLILYKNTWAALEVKRNITARRQPNQKYYVDTLDNMSFASFVCPENKEDILDELQLAFSPSRRARISCP